MIAWDERERTIVKAHVVEPFLPDHTAEGELPRLVEFRLAQREQRVPLPELPPPGPRPPDPPPGPSGDYFRESQRATEAMIIDEIVRRERNQVWVRITWRSQMGRWSTMELQTG